MGKTRCICGYSPLRNANRCPFGHKLNERQRDKRELPDLHLAVSSDILNSAYACASIKLLRRIENNYKSKKTQLQTISMTLTPEIFIKIYLEMQTVFGNLPLITAPRTIDLKIQIRRRHQRRCAPLYDFSLRYDVEDTKQKGGWKTALSLFNEKQGTDAHATIRKYYPYLGGETVGKQCRKEWDFLAGFAWDSHFGSQLFQPKRTGCRFC